MAYSVDWISKVFTIPQSDLTFISGNNYALSLVDVHEELRRLEWAFADGLWAPRIINFFETVTLSGVPKTPSVEVTNGYTMNFTGSNYNVILSDYDNNLVDVYVPSNGISILGNNSVGRQTVLSGSGLNVAQDTKLTEVHGELRAIEGGEHHSWFMRVLMSAIGGKLTGPDPGVAGTVLGRDMADTKNRISATVNTHGWRTTPPTLDGD